MRCGGSSVPLLWVLPPLRGVWGAWGRQLLHPLQPFPLPLAVGLVSGHLPPPQLWVPLPLPLLPQRVALASGAWVGLRPLLLLQPLQPLPPFLLGPHPLLLLLPQHLLPQPPLEQRLVLVLGLLPPPLLHLLQPLSQPPPFHLEHPRHLLLLPLLLLLHPLPPLALHLDSAPLLHLLLLLSLVHPLQHFHLVRRHLLLLLPLPRRERRPHPPFHLEHWPQQLLQQLLLLQLLLLLFLLLLPPPHFPLVLPPLPPQQLLLVLLRHPLPQLGDFLLGSPQQQHLVLPQQQQQLLLRLLPQQCPLGFHLHLQLFLLLLLLRLRLRLPPPPFFHLVLLLPRQAAVTHRHPLQQLQPPLPNLVLLTHWLGLPLPPLKVVYPPPPPPAPLPLAH